MTTIFPSKKKKKFAGCIKQTSVIKLLIACDYLMLNNKYINGNLFIYLKYEVS